MQQKPEYEFLLMHIVGQMNKLIGLVESPGRNIGQSDAYQPHRLRESRDRNCGLAQHNELIALVCVIVMTVWVVQLWDGWIKLLHKIPEICGRTSDNNPVNVDP